MLTDTLSKLMMPMWQVVRSHNQLNRHRVQEHLLKTGMSWPPVSAQGNRFWKSENQKGEHKKNFSALSLRSYSGFDDFRSRCDATNPKAIPLRVRADAPKNIERH